MAVHDIVQINTPEGDTVLRARARKISRLDDTTRAIARDLIETLVTVSDGVGLAAPQIGESVRMIAIYIPRGYLEEDDPGFQMVLYNPQIVRRRGGKETEDEGCLSLRWWYGPVERDVEVTVRAYDLNDKEVRFTAHGFLARVFQHEIDHLDGIMFTDRMDDPGTHLRYVDPNAPKEGDEADAVTEEPVAAE
jgi:peptide deformylase